MTETGVMPTPQPFEILLVEDSPADARLTREALKDAKVWHNLYMVGDGVEAMDFLHRRGRFDDIEKVYNLNANCFISKPVDFEQFTKIVRSIEEFWFTVVSRLPK